MGKNQIVILNGNDVQEFEILRRAIDSNDEPFYLCADKDNEVVAVLIKKIEDIKKMEGKVIGKIIEKDNEIK